MASRRIGASASSGVSAGVGAGVSSALFERRFGKPAEVTEAAGAVGTAAGVSTTCVNGASGTGAASVGAGAPAAAPGCSMVVSGAASASGPLRDRRCGKPAAVVPTASSATGAAGVAGAATGAAGATTGATGEAGVKVGASNTSASLGAAVETGASVARELTSTGFASSLESKRTGKSTKAIVPRRFPSPVGSALVRRTVMPRSCERRPTTNSPRYADGASAKSTGFFNRSFASPIARSSIPMPWSTMARR